MTAPAAGDQRRYWLDDPKNVRTVVRALTAACVLAFLASVLAVGHGFALEGIFGFYAIYGFVAIVALVMIAKALRTVLMRPETYYDDDRY